MRYDDEFPKCCAVINLYFELFVEGDTSNIKVYFRTIHAAMFSEKSLSMETYYRVLFTNSSPSTGNHFQLLPPTARWVYARLITLRLRISAIL